MNIYILTHSHFSDGYKCIFGKEAPDILDQYFATFPSLPFYKEGIWVMIVSFNN